MPTPEGLYTQAEVNELINTKIRERVAEDADKLREHKANAAKWQAEAETHQKRATEFEAAAAKAGRLSSDLAAARAGITDPDDARELRGAYAASVEDMAEKDRPDLATWLATPRGQKVAARFAPNPTPSAPPAETPKPPDGSAPAPAPPVAPAPVAAPPPTRALSLPAPPPASRLSPEAHAARVGPLKEERGRLSQTPEGRASARYAELTGLITQAGREASQGA